MTRYLLLICCLLPLTSYAVKLDKGDYRYREDVEAFINDLAASSGYSEQELVDLFSSVQNQRQLFELMDRPAEKLDWYQYRKIFVTDKRIKTGVDFWKQHKQLLQQVEQKYRVPAEIIVAIVGVETFYGAHRGKYPVFDTLVTFAFDYPKRARFFTEELKQFLILAREQKLDPRSVLGSYAGAMGMPQFISSSYRNYAVDFDGDGQANLFDSLPDVLGSVANYFSRHGWQSGEEVTFPLTALDAGKVEQLKPGMKPNYSWKQLKSAGLQTDQPLTDDKQVALLKLQQPSTAEYWAGLNNFYVITRYNHSELYAMAVYQLSQKLKQAMG
jgi:membrane-bound lytic murein transglycosylase B